MPRVAEEKNDLSRDSRIQERVAEAFAALYMLVRGIVPRSLHISFSTPRMPSQLLHPPPIHSIRAGTEPRPPLALSCGTRNVFQLNGYQQPLVEWSHFQLHDVHPWADRHPAARQAALLGALPVGRGFFSA